MRRIKNIGSKIYRQYKYLQRNLAGIFGMHRSLFATARGNRIIIYHGICREAPTRFNTLFVTEKTFEKHLQFYRKYFNVVSLSDFFNRKFNEDKFIIALSFDDGFASSNKYVVPLLEKYGLPATFFITAIRKEGYNILWNDFLTIASVTTPRKLVFEDEIFTKKNRTYVSSSTKQTLAETLRWHGFAKKKTLMEMLEPYTSFVKGNDTADYWLQMTVEEIRAAATSPLITVGSHGFYHNDLGRIPVTQMAWELQASKTFLEEIIRKPVTQIAFPYGSYNNETVAEAEKAGYTQQYAAAFLYPGDNNDHRLRERMGVNPFISVHNQMLAIIKGNYE